MTKKSMVNRIAVETRTPKVRVARIVDLFLQEMIDELVRDGRLELRGFGVLKVVDIEARDGRNPKTGDTVHIPAAKHVRFKASKNMRERINAPPEPRRRRRRRG